MDVTTFDVRDRVKRDMISAASIGDFVLGPGTAAADAAFLAATASISPYCIDAVRGEIVLVELPEEVDLASAAFVYEVQYRHARRIHAVKIADFIALAAGLPAPARTVLVHSTGRCGSTLLMRALDAVPDVTTLSEPDVFSQLAMTGRPAEPAPEQFARLYGALLRVFGRGRSGTLAFKFRSVVCEHADYLAASLPEAASVFLYRDAIAVARSYARVTNRPLTGWVLTPGQRRAWSRFVPLLARLDWPLDGHDLMAALWAGPVLRYLDSWPTGIWRGAIDYADLLERPAAIVGAALSGPGEASAEARLPAPVFATHSQAGSHLAPDRLDADPAVAAELASAAFAERIAASLARIDPRLHPGMTLPGALLADCRLPPRFSGASLEGRPRGP
jgi:hypothetical protein